MARILIVDDSVFMRKLLSDILIKAGHQVVGEAGDAKEATSLYDKCKPDLVTMDIIMPETDGLDGMGAVREILKKDPKAQIIMVSAMGQKKFIDEAIQVGAKDYIVKPFQPTKISQTIARFTRKAA